MKTKRKRLCGVSLDWSHCNCEITERRGVSRAGCTLDSYPEALQAEDHVLMHQQEFVDTVNDAISQYDGMGSDCSSPITTPFLEASNNNWLANLAGDTTDRSSTLSTVTYDVTAYDKEASLLVEKLFDEINCVLFESADSPHHLPVYNECKDWSEAFPHLRILGHQVVPSLENGYHMIESRCGAASDISSADLHSRTDHSSSFSDSFGDGVNSSLMIEGSQVRIQNFSASTTTSTSYQYSDMTHLTEEVFVLDGYYEDIIAMDFDQHEELKEVKAIVSSQLQRRTRYPPITPNACAKDDITNSVFDTIWRMLTCALRILLQRYSEHFFITHPMTITGAEETDHEGGHLKLPQILMSGSRLDGMNVPAVHSNHRLISGSVLSRPYPAQTHNTNDNLRKILQISKMEMTTREKTLLEEGIETPSRDNRDSKRLNGARNMSASRRGYGRGKHLLPLDGRNRTPNVDDEVVRGQALSVGNKRLSSPPTSKTLPPILTSELIPLPQLGHADSTAAQALRGLKTRGNRASSAIADKESRPSLKEKYAMIAETRPSTTHTIYPTDQSGLLNMGLHCQQPPVIPTERPTARLSITGSSLIGPHTVLDEEVEGRYDPASHHSQWVPPHTATGGLRRKGILSSVVR